MTGDLVTLDPTQVQALSPAMREVAVSTYLEHAKNWLATAVEQTGPEQVALKRAEIATAAEAAKQLNLSREIREDATEMVRRAEYSVSRAIRKGQAEGTVRTKGQRAPQTPYERNRFGSIETVQAGAADSGNCLPGPTDLAPDFYTNGSEIASLAAFEPDEFDKALDDAKAEGNLSRANVVRKIKGETNSKPLTRDQRADLIGDLADQGYSSHQMADKVGVSAARVREIARAFSIDIAADRAVGRQVRIDHTAAVESAVTSLDNWASSLTFIDFNQVDGSEADEWVASLSNSLTELRRFIKQIKETTHV